MGIKNLNQITCDVLGCPALVESDPTSKEIPPDWKWHGWLSTNDDEPIISRCLLCPNHVKAVNAVLAGKKKPGPKKKALEQAQDKQQAAAASPEVHRDTPARKRAGYKKARGAITPPVGAPSPEAAVRIIRDDPLATLDIRTPRGKGDYQISLNGTTVAAPLLKTAVVRLFAELGITKEGESPDLLTIVNSYPDSENKTKLLRILEPPQ